ncbi:MAG: TetR/AcrR family transcriptional regulator [Chloroflexi bacterium]|nr:TetR/AcrR family transcriptional regulator [Chloroflexota bacterium]
MERASHLCQPRIYDRWGRLDLPPKQHPRHRRLRALPETRRGARVRLDPWRSGAYIDTDRLVGIFTEADVANYFVHAPTKGGTRSIRSGQARERILDAAAEVFADHGYHGASVDQIARASASSKGAIYFHFPGKRQVFFALVQRFADQLLRDLETATAGPPSGAAQAEAAIRGVLRTFARHRRLAKVLLTSGVGLGPAFDETLLALHTRFADAIRSHLDMAVAQGSIPPQDTETAAYAWLGALNEVILRWLYAGRPESLEAATPTLQTLLFRSVGAQVPARTEVATP